MTFDPITFDPITFKAALALSREHGDTAWFEAELQADKCLDEGDLDGAAKWRSVLVALKELERQVPTAGEEMH